MAGGNRKIHEHPNAGKGGFDVNPQNAGRPKKKFSDHINSLKKKGYQAPTKAEYFDMVGLLLAMEEDDLKEFAEDKTKPYWIRLIVVDMNSKTTRVKMMADYRDWLFGKAVQENKTELSGEVKSETPDLSKLSKKELAELKKLQEKLRK
jgi:hypothetical protein